MADTYAGACWNQLMENETKESIAEMYMGALDEVRKLKARIAELEQPMERFGIGDGWPDARYSVLTPDARGGKS